MHIGIIFMKLVKKKMLQNEPCLHYGPWGLTDILDKIIFFFILLKKIIEKCKKLLNYFIIISIFNPNKSYNKCHRLSIWMSQTRLIYCICHFLGRNRRFLAKICETIEYQVLLNSCRHKLSECDQ
jgi:hypothetical protein